MSNQEDDEVKARMKIAGGEIVLARWGELAIHQTVPFDEEQTTVILSQNDVRELHDFLRTHIPGMYHPVAPR